MSFGVKEPANARLWSRYPLSVEVEEDKSVTAGTGIIPYALTRGVPIGSDEVLSPNGTARTS